jgi:predicted transcriptional regulator
VNNKKKIFIGVGGFNAFKRDVIHGVKRLEAGLPAEEPRHKIFFANSAHLFKTLSPKRMELLKFLKKHGPLSRRQLAIKLNRAYANVHDDIKELMSIDLAKTNREKKIFVPWDEIDIALPLAA